MKAVLLTLATLTIVGRTALAADTAAPPTVAADADVACVPGMTAPAPDVCSLPGFHWEYTTAYFGRHDRVRSEWMLVPDR